MRILTARSTGIRSLSKQDASKPASMRKLYFTFPLILSRVLTIHRRQYYKRMREKWKDSIPGIGDTPPSAAKSGKGGHPVTPAKAGKGAKKRSAQEMKAGADYDSWDDDDANQIRKIAKKNHDDVAGNTGAGAGGKTSKIKHEEKFPMRIAPPASMPKIVQVAEEDAWERAVERAASHATEDSIFDGRYRGASKPYRYFDARDNQMKT